jgi:RNA-directed DNA polymerase
LATKRLVGTFCPFSSGISPFGWNSNAREQQHSSVRRITILNTSTPISNLVFFDTDVQLAAFCKKNNITYTRYVDDLTFSSQQNFGHLIRDILLIISANYFKVNHRKTDYAPYQLITGIQIFLYKIDGSDKIIEKAKEELLNDRPTKSVNIYLNNIRKTNKKKGK